jgi:hypothetical protein
MKLRVKRRYWVLACALVIAAVAAWVEPTGVIRGWLRGEAFYDGRPTNYWSRELARWQYNNLLGLSWITPKSYSSSTVVDLRISNSNFGIIAADAAPDPEVEQEPIQGDDILVDSGLYSLYASIVLDSSGSYTRTPGILDKVAGWFGVTLDPGEPPAVLRGDPAAEAVLRELLEDANETVRQHAQRALNESKSKVPE